jgi:hypothetical protein
LLELVLVPVVASLLILVPVIATLLVIPASHSGRRVGVRHDAGDRASAATLLPVISALLPVISALLPSLVTAVPASLVARNRRALRAVVEIALDRRSISESAQEDGAAERLLTRNHNGHECPPEDTACGTCRSCKH